MEVREWTNMEVYYLLRNINWSYPITESEQTVLDTWEKLDISNKKLTSLPRKIGLLQALKHLNISNNPISKLPKSSGQLKKLQILDGSNTHISSLPEFICDLTELRILNLSNTPITNLPESIGNLTGLQVLDLSNTAITNLPDSVGKLTRLKKLDLSNTTIASLPNSIGMLTGLEELNLNSTQINTLPDSIGMLMKLQQLSLISSPVLTLPNSVGQLTKLQRLHLSGTLLTTLPDSIGQLASLQELTLGSSQITTLPETLGKIQSLEILSIPFTPISVLPWSLALGNLKIYNETQFGSKSNLYSSGMPWSFTSFPRDVFGSFFESGPYLGTPFSHGRSGIYAAGTRLPPEYFAGKEVLKKFFNEKERRGFGEAKVIFLGDGNAGKTYTINRIINGDEKEPKPGQLYSQGQTHGVRPYDWPYHTSEGETFTLHLWDFGGQEMLHAMHRCFLTQNTVYAVMVSTRASEHTRRIRYWLNSIYAYAKGTSVTVFVNVFDNHGTAKIEKKRLAAEFPELDLCFETLSVKDAENEEFHAKVTEPLIRKAREAEKACGLWPASYMRIKDRIKEAFQQLDQKSQRCGWFPSAEYREFCQLEGADNLEEQEDLLRYFSDLGVCFSSLSDREKPVQEDFRLIKPIWLTNALYAIIEECQAVQGKVLRSEIEERLSKEQTISKSEDYVRVAPELRYDPEDCKFVLRIAAHYKLIYEDREDSNRVFFPAACTEERPDSVKKPESPAYNVVCETDYPYLPETVVQRLMVDCLLDGYQLESCWHGGFLLKTVGCAALADTVRDDRSLRLDIWSDDKEQPVKRLLLKLLKHLDTEAVAGKTPQTFVIRNEERFSIRRLRNAEDKGVRQVVGDEGPAIEVRELLGAFPIPRNRTYWAEDDPWLRFRGIHSSATDAFEKLCYEFFQEKYFDDSEYPNMPKNYPGVETIVTFSKRQKTLVGFQAKFFEDASASDATAKIKRSAQKAIDQYKGQKGYLFVYSNKELNEQNEAFDEIRSLLAKHEITLKCSFGIALYKEIKDNYPELEHDYFTPLGAD